MTKTPRTLLEMKSLPTTYEVVATDGNNVSRLGFINSKSENALLSTLDFDDNWYIVAAMRSDEKTHGVFGGKSGWVFGNVTVKLSGKTERQCSKDSVSLNS